MVSFEHFIIFLERVMVPQNGGKFRNQGEFVKMQMITQGATNGNLSTTDGKFQIFFFIFIETMIILNLGNFGSNYGHF